MAIHRFQPGNTIGTATRWKLGEKVGGAGRPPRMTTSLKEWWNVLCAEDDHGWSKYSVTDLEKIASAKKSDKSIPITKRLAARQILKTLGPKGDARKMAELFFDRLEGKPRQEISLEANFTEVKRIVLIEEEPDGSHIPALVQAVIPAIPAKPPPLLPVVQALNEKGEVETVSIPIETRRPPLELQLTPGVVEDPVEINPTTGLPRHPLDVS